MENGDGGEHLVLFPFPTQGHVIPFFNLAVTFLSSSPSISISFLCTRNSYGKLSRSRKGLTELNLHIQFIIIPEEEEEEEEEEGGGGGGGDRKKGSPFPEDLSENTGTMVASLIHLFDQIDWVKGRSQAIKKALGTVPATCIVADFFLPWTRQLAACIGARWCIFSTSSVNWLKNSATIASGVYADSVLFGSNPNESMPPPVASWFKCNKEFCQSLAVSDCVLLNAFPDIDGAIAASIPGMERTPMKAIGPVLPPSHFSVLATSLGNKEEGMESLAWLDRQPLSSVVYISFGNVAKLSEEQLHHLALGIEASGCRFLWVIRQDNQSENLQKLLEGFLDLSRGCVVAWAPQLQVLQHPALAFFLTHCGWNSIVESVYAGVPMLCMPCFGDQFLNCDQVVNMWGIGLPFIKINPEGGNFMDQGMVEKTEIERVLRTATEEETSKHLKEKAIHFSELARRSLEKDGSSYKNMIEFFQIISTKMIPLSFGE